MAQAQSSNAQSANKKKKTFNIPILSPLWRFIVQNAAVMILAGGISVGIELIIYFWQDDGSYLRAFNNYERAVFYAGDVGEWLDIMVVYDWLMEKMQTYVTVNDIFAQIEASKEAMVSKANGNEYINAGAQGLSDILVIIIISTLAWLVKVLTIVAYTPVYIVCAYIGIVDGAAKRKIMTYKGERDSSERVEWWYRRFREASFLAIFMYVAIPHSLPAVYIFVPSAMTTGFVLRMLSRHFMKYW